MRNVDIKAENLEKKKPGWEQNNSIFLTVVWGLNTLGLWQWCKHGIYMVCTNKHYIIIILLLSLEDVRPISRDVLPSPQFLHLYPTAKT